MRAQEPGVIGHILLVRERPPTGLVWQGLAVSRHDVASSSISHRLCNVLAPNPPGNIAFLMQ